MKKAFLNEYSASELKELLKEPEKITAICCFGSCESHGWHCCLGPDYFVPTEVSKRVALKILIPTDFMMYLKNFATEKSLGGIKPSHSKAFH